MTQVPSLPAAPVDRPAMDFALLRAEGIRQLEQMAGGAWTDFNSHDPGITILEQLCYAITDLGHRIDYKIPDLLASEGADAYQSLYSPSQILTSHPVTLTDFRKLLLDVEGVKNAWIEPVEQPAVPLHFHSGRNELSLQENPPATEPIRLKGLYRVLIEKSDLADIDGSLVLRNAVARLHANRTLGEDFEEIRVLDSQDIQVRADVEIGPVDDAEAVLLNIYEQVADYLSPRIPFATLDEMLEAGRRVDEIYDGPILERGFIDSGALEQIQRRSAVYTSDLIQRIMRVPGVRAVRHISVTADGNADKWEEWSLDLDPQRAPRLDLERPQITLKKDRLSVNVDVAKVCDAHAARLKGSSAFQKLAPRQREVAPPPGRDRRVGHYHSVQHQFPALYGIGSMGLPDSASPQRKAQASQLKAYLLFFDQLLANHFAQLAHVNDLFSFHGDGSPTYFAQEINDPSLGLESIRDPDPTRLQEITENSGGSPASAPRKHRFLNHLLARFAEQFADYSLVGRGAMPQPDAAPEESLVHAKQALLQNYARLSSARGTAMNYLLPPGSHNRSGLAERIRLKLGLAEQDTESFFLVEHILLRPIAEDERQQIPLLENVRRKDPWSLQLSFVFPKNAPRFRHDDFRQFVEHTVRNETPAHLTPYVHWLDDESMKSFKAAYDDWLTKRSRYWTKKAGL